MTAASERLFEKAMSKAQMQPRARNEEDEAVLYSKSEVLKRWQKSRGKSFQESRDAGRMGIDWEDFGDVLSHLDELPVVTPEILKESGFTSLDLKWGPSFHDPVFKPEFRTEDDPGRWPMTEAGIQQAFRTGEKESLRNWELSRENDRSQFQPAEERSRQRARPGRAMFEQARRYHPVNIELEKIREGESSGQTFNKRGDVWQPGEKPVDIVTLASVNVPIKDLTMDAYFDAIEPYKELLGDDVVAGVFKFGEGDTASIDINAVVPQEHRDNTVAFAKANDQMSIWDAAKQEEVKTGGSGDTRLKSLPELRNALASLLAGEEVQFQPISDQPGYQRPSESKTAADAYAAYVSLAQAGNRRRPRYYMGESVSSKKQSTRERNAFDLWQRLKAEEDAQKTDPSAQFQPQRADKDLFGFEEKLSIRETSKLPRAELLEIYPEAVVPKDRNESIPSKITESPLYKKSEDPVKAFSDELVKFAREVQKNPVAKAGAEWYDKFTPMLKKEFGEDAQLFAELLAATSPNTGVETNFKFALDALDSFKSGRFEKTISKFNQGMDMIANESWLSWYNKELKNIPNPPKKPTAATFLEHWIFKHDLKPRQTNGKLYGIHSLPVLQVFARQWLTEARGPKTLNFVENLIGKSDEATIDIWADRTMRRIGYEGQERWRILPKNTTGVRDEDFAFAQSAFRQAAQRLGMKPSALQGMLWFAEKQLWAENAWADLNLGDFSKEMETIPARRAKARDLTSAKKPDKLQIEIRDLR